MESLVVVVVIFNNSLVTGDPAQHMESMENLVVVVIFNNSLVTEGGGVLLKQLPSQVKWSWKRS